LAGGESFRSLVPTAGKQRPSSFVVVLLACVLPSASGLVAASGLGVVGGTRVLDGIPTTSRYIVSNKIANAGRHHRLGLIIFNYDVCCFMVQ